MKNILYTLALFVSFSSSGQVIESFKKKTSANTKERTLILDIVRASLYQDYRQEFIFVVNTLNVSSKYAWFQGTAVRKDGREVVTSDDDDCCHVEGLLKRNYGKWYIVELVAFSTDVWWSGIWDTYNIPRKLFNRIY